MNDRKSEAEVVCLISQSLFRSELFGLVFLEYPILEVCMYQTSVKGEGLFQVRSQGYGDPIRTFGVAEQGETPVSLLNIALASCVAMCVQGYYARIEGDKTMPVRVDSQLNLIDKSCQLCIFIGESLSAQKEEAILAYIAEKCKVKALLRDDMDVHFQFTAIEEEG